MALDVSALGHDHWRQVKPMDVVCGIDPGREKFGLAIARTDGLALSAVIPVQDADAALAALAAGRWKELARWQTERAASVDELREMAGSAEEFVVRVGDGTGAAFFIEKLRSLGARCVLVDEKNTTRIARERYWQLHPPRGLLRLIPRSLRVPPRPVDDLAAWAIAERGKICGE